MELEYRYADPVTLATVTAIVSPYERWQDMKGSDIERLSVGKREYQHRSPRKGKEKVAKGAFRTILGLVETGKREIKAFMAHHAERIIGRTGNGTLKLRDTDQGLSFDLSLPDTTDGRDALTLIQRGDIGSSIGFVRKESELKTGFDESDQTYWQVFTQMDLREISLTASPAWKGTEVLTVRAAWQAAEAEATDEQRLAEINAAQVYRWDWLCE